MNNKQNIAVIVNQSTGYLTIDVVNAFAEKYDKVFLIAGSVTIFERKLNNNVTIDHIVKYNRNSSLKRICTWSIASLQIFFKLLFKYRDCYVLFFSNPPLSYLSQKFINNRFEICIYDLFPDNLYNIGLKENSFIIIWWKKFNRKIFAKAERIITLSGGMANAASKYVDIQKIDIIPNWPSSNNFIQIKKNNNPFIKKHHLEEKFIVLYSGNIGFTHNVETIIEVADRLKDKQQFLFLIIGEGMKKDKIISMAKDRNLNNCKFLPFQEHDIMPYSLGCADVGIVTLTPDTTSSSVPSKIYNLLYVGSPILGIAQKESEIAHLINTYQNGACFESKDIECISEFLIKLEKDKQLLQKMRKNSLSASKNFTYKNAALYLPKDI